MKLTPKQLGLALLVALVMTGNAMASSSSGGAFISDLHEFMKTSLEGMVGTTIAIGGLGYGLIAGIAKGSMAGLGVGLGLAIAAFYGPKIIGALGSAVVLAF